ncbi:MAG: hypothetical protein ABI724_03615 [Betaproteobacteria bacterium]
MKIIFVAGAWGSGTTALAGALHHLGVATFGPYFRSYDPITLNTFEWTAFRDVVLRHTNEYTMSRVSESASLVSDLRRFRDEVDAGAFGPWPVGKSRNLMLKLPIASICLPEMVEALDPLIIVMHRPFEEIERTRQRRNWPAPFGKKGASIIYPRLVQDLVNLRKSFLALSYQQLVADTASTLRLAIDFCGLHELDARLDDACRFVRHEATPGDFRGADPEAFKRQ